MMVDTGTGDRRGCSLCGACGGCCSCCCNRVETCLPSPPSCSHSSLSQLHNTPRHDILPFSSLLFGSRSHTADTRSHGCCRCALAWSLLPSSTVGGLAPQAIEPASLPPRLDSQPLDAVTGT